MRFQKRVKILPGVRLNFSKSGVSTTIGGKGASVNIGKKGTYLNTSIPGTGLSERTRLDTGGSRSSGRVQHAISKTDLLRRLFPADSLPALSDALAEVDAAALENAFANLKLRNPTTALLLSFFLGWLGIDRFYISQTGLGVAKLLTLGGLGLWSLVDLFLIMGATKQSNLKILTSVVAEEEPTDTDLVVVQD